MVQRILDSAVIYVLIALLLALSAIFQTVSEETWVVNLEWVGAILFALIGLWREKRRRRLELEAELNEEEAEEDGNRTWSNRE